MGLHLEHMVGPVVLGSMVLRSIMVQESMVCRKLVESVVLGPMVLRSLVSQTILEL